VSSEGLGRSSLVDEELVGVIRVSRSKWESGGKLIADPEDCVDGAAGLDTTNRLVQPLWKLAAD
jgi:hypothetical protein